MATNYKSKAVRLAEELLKDIWRQAYSADAYLPAEEELARRYGSSRMTIRKVVGILERDHVLVRIPNCGSRINPELKLPEPTAAAEGDPIVIGAVMAAFPDALTIEVNRGIQDCAARNGMSFRLIQNPEGPEALAADIRTMGLGRFSGLIWLGTAQSCRDEVRRLAEAHFPLVCVDNPLEGLTLPYVGVDNFGGMYTAATSLLSFFRSGIHYLGSPPELVTQKRRYDGYCRAMCDYGLRTRIHEYTTFFRKPNESEHWFEADNDRTAMEAAARLLANPEPFGVVAENDYIAQALLDTAERMQRKPGKDFFVCGFDDLPLAESRDLSSIRQPRYELGYEAARLLGDIIAGREAGTINKVLPVTLIPRGSSNVANAHSGAALSNAKHHPTTIQKGLNV